MTLLFKYKKALVRKSAEENGLLKLWQQDGITENPQKHKNYPPKMRISKFCSNFMRIPKSKNTPNMYKSTSLTCYCTKMCPIWCDFSKKQNYLQKTIAYFDIVCCRKKNCNLSHEHRQNTWN